MARVLITGGTGFAGSHLIEALLAQGYDDVHTTTYGKVLPEVKSLLPRAKFHKLDLTNASATADLIKKLQPEHIYHLAAVAAVGNSFENAGKVFQNNINLQLNLLNAVRQHAPNARVLIVGSAEEYGFSEPDEIPINEDHPLRPVNPYAVSKVTQDLLGYSFGQSFDLQILRVRPFNHIGERQSKDFVVPAFVSQIVAIEQGHQQVLKVGNLESVRDFTDVKDMVRGYITVMEQAEPLEVYNLGSGQGIKMKALLKQLQDLAKVEVPVEPDPERMRPSDVPEMVANINKIAGLDWEPTIPLEQTLERIFAWHRQRSGQ